MKDLLSYQDKHITNLGLKVAERVKENIQKAGSDKAKIKYRFLLHAPTGSGKTVMLAEMVRRYLKNSVIIVLSPGAGDLETQTRKAFENYLGDSGITVNDLTSDVLNTPATAGSVFVKNWEAVAGIDRRTGEYRTKLSKKSEFNNVFDWLDKIAKTGVPIVIVIDEAHYGSKSGASSIMKFLDELSETVVNTAGYSPVVIEATATPIYNKRGTLIAAENAILTEEKITYEEAIDAGLLRKAIVLNDGIEKLNFKDDLDTEKMLLEAAYRRMLKVDKIYADAGSKFHALIGIQIPASNLGKECRKRVEAFFAKKGITVANGQLATYFNEEKIGDLANIASPDSPVKVLIYKQAIAMGWNCPRAQILVGFRHIKSISFSQQNAGRFVRTTEGRHYTIKDTKDFEYLNQTYIYSNENIAEIYKQNDLIASGEIQFITKLSLDEQSQKLVEEYNSHHFPISYVSRKVVVKIDRKKIVRIVQKTAKGRSFHFKSDKNIDNEKLSTGKMSTYKLDIANPSIDFDQKKSISAKHSNAEIDEKWISCLNGMLRYSSIPQYGTVSRILAPLIPKLKEIKDSIPGDEYDIKRTLLHIDNAEELKQFIEEILKDSFFQKDDFAIPETDSDIKISVGHELPSEIYVKNNENSRYTGKPAEIALYNQKIPYGYNSYGLDTGIKSGPEKIFESLTMNFAHSSDEEKGKINGNSNYILLKHYKNPSYMGQGAFSLGLQFSIEYEEEEEKKRANFFPDYLLFIREEATGKVFPVIVEIKDEDGGQNSKQLLEAKIKASEKYMENTGLPFVILQLNNSKDNFYRYGTNESFEEFLNRVSKNNIKTFDNTSDISWMKSLGE